MVAFTSILLYVIAALLGAWSASLLWRAWQARQLAQRGSAEAPASKDAPPVQRPRFGVGVALIALPLAVVAFAAGEVVRGGSADSNSRFVSLFVNAGVAMLVLLAVGAAYVAFRFDPALGRKRCGKCWYDMSATPGRRCPECGHEPKSDKGLFRTRRAPRMLVVPLILFAAAYTLYASPRIVKEGWRGGVPTTVMIVGLPWFGDEILNRGSGCLRDRVEERELWCWQRSFLVWRCKTVLAGSADLEDVTRAMSVLPNEGRSKPMQLGAPAILALVKKECNATVGRFTSFSLYYLVPRTMPAEIREDAFGMISAGLDSESEGARSGAAGWVGMLGADAAPLMERLGAIVRDETENLGVRQRATQGLWGLASTDDAAWAIVKWTATCDHADLRVTAFRMMSVIQGRDAEIEALLVTGMADPADAPAGRAAAARAMRAADPCTLTPELMALAERRPATAREFISIVAQCPDDRVVACIERMLASSDPLDEEMGAMAAASTNELGERLLPLLDGFTRYEGMRDSRAQFARESAKQIRRAVEMRRNAEPERIAPGK